MVITVFKVVPPHEVRQEVVAEIVLRERRGPIDTFSVERYPVKFEEEEMEVTVHFAPHNKSVSLAVVQKSEMIAQFLFFCPHPCEFNFRLPSSLMVRMFFDAAQTTLRYEKKT
ncbi:MAG TPA: hypothetical protein VG734_23345 [Lacunisphaera sp.]|nr:hypothetical protein [Lacunisphaera sp.]